MTEGITWEIAVIGLSLTLFTLTNVLSKSYKHKTDLVLCVWLVLLNIPLLHTVFLHMNIDAPVFHLYTNPVLNLLHGPILYLYVRMLVSVEKTIKYRSELLHFIPFAVLYLVFISMTHSDPMMMPSPGEEDISTGSVVHSEIAGLFKPLLVHFGVVNGLLFLAYSILTIVTLMKHQKKITGFFSQNDNQISIKWIYALPAIFAVLVVFNFVNENVSASGNLIDPHTFHMLCFLCFIILLCFFGVKQKPVFYFRRPLLLKDQAEAKLQHKQEEDETKNTETNTANTEGNNDAFIADALEKMQAYMSREKPYLDPDFSVYTMAEALGMPRRAVSLMLNSGLSKNFYQYVNERRIEEVKTLLASEDARQLTILDIAFQSGFKSKSSFNSLFKQHCDMTPSQYRKSVRQ